MKYIALSKPPVSAWDDDYQAPTTMTVHCDDTRPVDTGLFDHTGMKIYRVAERARMGFWK